MSNNNLFLDHDMYTFKNALLWGLFTEHCEQVKYGELSTGHKCYHIGMAILEFFPVLSQLVSLVELVVQKTFDCFNKLYHEHNHSYDNSSINFIDESNKNKADAMVNTLNPFISNEEIQILLDFNLPEERLWLRQDLYNNSELQQIYLIMGNTWYSSDLCSNNFPYHFAFGYGIPLSQAINSFINGATDIRHLFAMSTFLIYSEIRNRNKDNRDYQNATDQGCTYIAFANQGFLHTWLQKSQELLRQ